ncbi:MAG: hypothetical protein V4548_01120 [Bacteroidota bacterium]
MKLNFFCIVYFLVVTPFCFSQSQKELYTLSIEAYKNKNYAEFLKITKKLDSIRPSHPAYTYNLAVAYNLNNQKEMAISVLKNAILMNNKVAFEEDLDFSNLHQTEGYKELIDLKINQEKPVIGSTKVVSLSEKSLHPESVLFLPKLGIWLASSIRKRKIVTFNMTTGKCGDYAVKNNLLSVFAMKTDDAEKYLWIATAAMPEMEGFSKDLKGKSEIVKGSIQTGEIVNRFPLEGNHIFGDLVIAKSGIVYVSDSGEAVIYKISNDKIEPWLDLRKEAYNLQGLTFNADHSKLFIADYFKGILVISMKNPNDRKWLTFPKGTTVKGIDGLVYYKKSLIAVHNGVTPIRLIQYNLDDNENQITTYKILDNNRPEFDEPALATIVKDKLYFFANSPWKGYDKDFNLDENKFENPMLYSYPLKK